MASKRCRICTLRFLPDPRIGRRQRVCGRLACQRQRRRLKLRSWRARHPEHVKLHRGKQKAWAKAHSDYWRRYRARHPAYRRRDNQRRSRAMERQRRSANETQWRESVVEKVEALAALRGADCSANETQILRRVEAVEDCLLSTVAAACSAKEVHMAVARAVGG